MHPTVLFRLRVATGAHIHIVRRPERDAAYKAMFERWITRRPQRRARSRRKPAHSRPFAVEAEGEPSSLSALLAQSPTSINDLKAASQAAKAPLSVRLSARFSMLLMRLHLAVWGRSRPVQYMAQGALMVWLFWFLLTTSSAPLLLPILVLALCVISASPVADLGLVALAFVVATAGAALAGLVSGVISERRHQLPDPMASVGVISLSPYVTLIALIARSEHGVVVATAIVTGLVSRPIIGRLFRRRIARQRRSEVLHQRENRR